MLQQTIVILPHCQSHAMAPNGSADNNTVNRIWSRYVLWKYYFSQITHITRRDYYISSTHDDVFRVIGPMCGEFTGEFPSQRPVTRSFDVSFDLRLNKRLSKRPRRRWFKTPSRSQWRHCNLSVLAGFLMLTFTTTELETAVSILQIIFFSNAFVDWIWLNFD